MIREAVILSIEKLIFKKNKVNRGDDIIIILKISEFLPTIDYLKHRNW